jgi:hypothetical protein
MCELCRAFHCTLLMLQQACGHEGFDDLEELTRDGILWLRQRIEEGTNFTTTVSSNANAGYNWPTGAAAGRTCRRMWTNTRNWLVGSDLSPPQKTVFTTSTYSSSVDHNSSLATFYYHTRPFNLTLLHAQRQREVTVPRLCQASW